MSDDDFVARMPIRTYKRRKRTAPLAVRDSDVEALTEVLLNSPEKRSRLPTPSPEKKKCRSIVSGESGDRKSNPLEQSATDLEAFLADHKASFKLNTSIPFDLPDLEVETVARDQEEEKGPPKPVSPEKPDFGDIKLATQVLFEKSNRKKMRQSSLFNIIKKESKPIAHSTAEDDLQKLDVENRAPKPVPSQFRTETKAALTMSSSTPKKPNPAKKPIPKTPKELLCGSKKLIKQAGSTQLDLGAMFGMKPKETPSPKESIKNEKKTAPFYKWIKGTSFTVDAFNFGEIPKCSAYFLSHFHSDHYMGLGKHFTSTVYCSTITAKYVINNLKVKPGSLIN